MNGDVRVDTYLKGQRWTLLVAAFPDGSAIIVWSSYGQDGNMQYGVFAATLPGHGSCRDGEGNFR